MKPTVALFGLSGVGHHPRYIRWVLDSRLSASCDLVLAGPDELLQHPEITGCSAPFRTHRISLSEAELRLFQDFSTPGLVRREFQVRRIYQRTYRALSRQGQVSAAFIPYADDCISAIGLAGSPFGSVSWVGLTMRTQYHFPAMGVVAPVQRGAAVRHWLHKRYMARPQLRALLSIDPSLLAYAEQYDTASLEKLVYLADPSELYTLPAQDSARRALGIPAEATVVLIYGAMTERKGVFTLVKAASSVECPAAVHVLLAGKQDAEVQAFLQGQEAAALRTQGRLHALSGYVPSDRESTVLAAADCMWVAYTGFYTMSSALVLASLNGLPAITSEEGVIGWLGRRHRLGVQVKAGSVESAVQALQKLVQDPSLDGAGQRGKLTFAAHTVPNFQETIAAAIERCL